MCDFHEPYFGANYPDACCIEGFLWDLDSCDAPGGDLHSGGDVPCPQCQHATWLEYAAKEELENDGYQAFTDGKPRAYSHAKVRHEQPEDRAKMEAWWNSGYDAARNEVRLAAGEAWQR